MTIGQLAARTGVGVETVRFYERRGLLPRPPRPDSGFRQYTPDAMSRITFIRRAKQLGFSLREIKELLSLRTQAGANCGSVKRCAEAKAAEIDAKIADLRRMRKTLTELAGACERLAAEEQGLRVVRVGCEDLRDERDDFRVAAQAREPARVEHPHASVVRSERLTGALEPAVGIFVACQPVERRDEHQELVGVDRVELQGRLVESAQAVKRERA